MGRALMGTGCATGEGRARAAAEQAITSPLLDDISVEGATGVLINIVGGPDMKMREIDEAAMLIQEQAHEDANIIFGASICESMTDMIKVAVIATGFDRPEQDAAEMLRQASRQPLERSSSLRRDARSSHAHVLSGRGEPTHVTVPVVAQHRSASSSMSPREQASASSAPRVRDEIVFPAPGKRTEPDWDVPAFQRRGHHG
jgi:cell division protein FtsZ